MGRPAKSLSDRIREGEFRARLHHGLLAGPPVQWPLVASMQHRYRAATSEAERRAIGLEVERFVRLARDELARRTSGSGGDAAAARLRERLAELGRPGSVQQLLGFFPSMLAHPRGPMFGQPFELESWQKQFLREFYRRDKHGRRVYRSGTLGVPRGNGKTPLAAGLGLYELVTRPDAPEVYCAACSREQASIGHGFARDFVELGPLNEWVQLKSGLYCPATRGKMMVISSDGRTQFGRSPSVGITDELWAFETKREEQAYKSLASGLHKRENPFLLAITTAGYDQHSLLGRIYTDALTWPSVETSHNDCLLVCKDLDNGYLLWWYGAPPGADIEDPKIWRAANPASWIKTSELKRQLADPGLGEHEFRRLSLNQWTSAKNAWLPGTTWRDLETDHEIPDRADIYIGVDIGITHDASVVAWAHKLPDGRILINARVWSADPNGQAHEHLDKFVEIAQIETYIHRLASKYHVLEVAFDPHFFARSAQQLDRDGYTTIEYPAYSNRTYEAYQLFYQLALEGKLAHNGDPILTAHIEATLATKTARGWQLGKHPSKHMDATVAACLATHRAHFDQPSTPDIRWMDW